MIFMIQQDFRNCLIIIFLDVILMIFLFLCALPLFYQEQIYGMEDMILATKKGRKTYVAGKYISVIAVIIMCTVVIACVNYIVFYITYGLKGSQMPIYALEEFQYSPYNLTLLQAYFCYTGTKMYGSHCCKHIDVSDIQYDKKHNDVVYHIYWSDCIWIIL